MNLCFLFLTITLAFGWPTPSKDEIECFQNVLNMKVYNPICGKNKKYGLFLFINRLQMDSVYRCYADAGFEKTNMEDCTKRGFEIYQGDTPLLGQ